jgi:hypothetical protein
MQGFERKRNEWSYYPILNVYVFCFQVGQVAV